MVVADGQRPALLAPLAPELTLCAALNDTKVLPHTFNVVFCWARAIIRNVSHCNLHLVKDLARSPIDRARRIVANRLFALTGASMG